MSQLSIFAREINGFDKEDVLDVKMDRLSNMVNNDMDSYDMENQYDRSIVLCSSEKIAGRVSKFLHQEGAHHQLFKDKTRENENETWTKNMSNFQDGDTLVAVTSFSAFEKSDFPAVRHYIVVDFPSKPAKMGRLLNELDSKSEKENLSINITFMVSPEFDEKIFNDALVMEMEIRGSEVPEFLKAGSTSIASSSSSLPTSDYGSFSDSSNGAPTTSENPFEFKKTLKRKASEPLFDYRNQKKNANGKYVLPAPEYDDEMGSDENEEDYIGEEYEELMPTWMFECD